MSSFPSLSPYDSDSSIDPDTFVPEFVELQTQLYSLKPELFDRPRKGKNSSRENLGGSEDPQILKIQRKISKIENDVLFDRREAEYLWKEKLDELRKEAVFFRRNAQQNATPPPIEPEKQEKLEEAKAESSSESENNLLPADGINEDENVGLFGDMFQAEGPILGPALNAELMNTSITLRDFGKSTGLSPRRVLEEACRARYGCLSVRLVAVSAKAEYVGTLDA